MTEYILRGKEAPVDLDLVDICDPHPAASTDADNVHVAQIAAAYINGVRIPLAQEQIRITLSDNEGTIAYLPVFVRTMQTLQAETYKREPDA